MNFSCILACQIKATLRRRVKAMKKVKAESKEVIRVTSPVS